ncbi:MAG: hemerythrin domain-containing protein [Gammaproteobacteria bacterium]|nr:hemerythrin domain-containing protein [Gammaproteobacteria bacterium]
MSESTNWLLHDHRKHQAALEACDIAAGVQEWKEATQRFNAFVDELKLHMQMEDEVLYPFFKEEAGDPDDEIGDLRYEHEKLAGLLRNLSIVIKHKDFDHFEECLKPLYEMLVEHNTHEEAVFSRVSGHALLNRREEILRRLEALHAGAPRHG